MNKYVVFFLIFSIMPACIPTATTTAPVQPSVPKETIKEIETKAADITKAEPLAVKTLDGYFLRNNVKLNGDINFFTASSQKEFENILGVSRKAGTMTFSPDFKDAMTAVIALKPSQNFYDIKIEKAYFIGNDVYLEYEITQKNSEEAGYFASNMRVFEIQKPKRVLNVSFVNTDKTMTVLPFGRRVIGSPSSLEVLLKYYTGRYKGSFLGRDGSGVSVILTLSSDYTYRMEQTYISNPARTFESAGQWAPGEDLSFFVLDYEKPRREQTAFHFIDKNMIEKLDENRERLPEKEAEYYRLKK